MKNKSGHEFVPTLTIYAVKFVYKPSKPKRRQANPQSQRVAQREDLITLRAQLAWGKTCCVSGVRVQETKEGEVHKYIHTTQQL